jgi:PPM family protein phosphatase
VELMTIGAFARAARLSPKALRRYDELGLLPPVAVDGTTGYRFYDPAQLDRARLIAWLRRLDMPLARIQSVVELDPVAAAEAVTAYWAEVVADTAGRGRLAAFLVDYLTGRGSAMTGTGITVGIRYAGHADIGKVRTSNEDTAYAGSRLLAVADGVSGEAGARASAAAVAAFQPLEARAVGAGELVEALGAAVGVAQRALRDIAASTVDGEAVTTFTAMLWSGARFGLVHIGDTRAYRLRDGVLRQLTHDHTWVQSLVDDGRMSLSEAAVHPQRALLARAFTGTGAGEPDISVHDAEAGDRYLLCSDGLTHTVSTESITEVLAGRSPDEAVTRLVERANEAGAPDNIACVVADVVTL